MSVKKNGKTPAPPPPLPPPAPPSKPTPPVLSPLKKAMDETREEAIVRALEHSSGNISRAAKTLGLARSRMMLLMSADYYGLIEFAAKLRIEAGGVRGVDGRVTGRPRE